MKYEPFEIEGVVYTADDARLFRFDAMLANFDSPYNDFSDCKLVSHNPIKIKGLNGPIGFADVFVEKSRLMAKCVIAYSQPERLDIENRAGLYASVNGAMITEEVPHLPMNFYGRKAKIKEILIYSIYLNKKKSQDSRIPVLGQPIL